MMFNEKDNDEALGWENSDDMSETPKPSAEADPQNSSAFPAKPVRPGPVPNMPARPARPTPATQSIISQETGSYNPEPTTPVFSPQPETNIPPVQPQKPASRTFTPIPVTPQTQPVQPNLVPEPTVPQYTPVPPQEIIQGTTPGTPVTDPASSGNRKRTAKKSKPKKENPYDGARKNTLIWRVVVGGAAVIVGLAGVQALFFPNTGPTKTQVVDAAQESMNFTGFPSVSGEQFAIDFSRAFFTFNGDLNARNERLSQYASEDLLRKIQVNVLTEQQFKEENPSGDYEAYLEERQISYGPYVVAVNNVTDTSSVFTVKIGLRSGSVYYMDVPVLYNPEQFSLTLYGPPSFVKPIQNEGETSPSDYTVNWGSGDTEIANSFRSDLEAYLRAWAVSDTTIIDRYTLPTATDNATRGLQGSVEFSSLDSFIVQPENEAANPATARGAEITVTWVDPLTGLEFPQQYRILLGLNQEGTWSVYDIENFAIFN